MTDDRAFLDALRADPADTARWLVYADWLDDRNDPRAEYLRLVTDLAAKPDPDRRRRLNAVRPSLPREWLAVVEQPALLRANPTPYPFSWPGFGLGDVRPTDATYTGNDYPTLPPVPVDSLVRFEEWYARVAADVPAIDPGPDEDEDEEFAEFQTLTEEDRLGAIPRLADAANDFGVPLPDRFARFFLDDRHPRLFRSVTDCFFSLPARVEPAPGCPEAGLIRFYSDSQGCLHWYLYLTPEGDECVVTSSSHLGGNWAIKQMAEMYSHPYEDDEDDAPGAISRFAPRRSPSSPSGAGWSRWPGTRCTRVMPGRWKRDMPTRRRSVPIWITIGSEYSRNSIGGLRGRRQLQPSGRGSTAYSVVCTVDEDP